MANSTIMVRADPSLTESRTLHVPTKLHRTKRPARALVWAWENEAATRRVVRMVATREDADDAAASVELHESLGGAGAQGFQCGY